MYRLVILLLLACLAPGADLGLGATSGTNLPLDNLGIPVNHRLGLSPPARTVAQIITAANFTDLNTAATYTSATGAWDPRTNTIKYPNQARTKTYTLNGVSYTATLMEAQHTSLMAAGTSEHFEQTTWVKGSGTPTVTADATTSPSGDTDADKLVEGAGTGLHSVAQSVTKAASAGVYGVAVFVKNFTGSRNVCVELDDGTTTNGVSMTFNPSTGAIVSAPVAFGTGWSIGGATCAVPNSYSITSVGSSWYRVVLMVNTDATTTIRALIALSNSGISYAGDSTSGVYLWGVDMELRAYMPTYVAARGLMKSSDDLTSTWTKNRCTASADTIANPLTSDVTADSLIEDSTVTQTHYAGQLFNAKPTASLSVTISTYAHANTRSWIAVGAGTAANALTNSARAFFDLTNGATGASVVAGSGWAVASKSIVSLGSGWYRCIVTITTDTSANLATHLFLATADSTTTYSGNGTSGVYIYGTQCEYGSTATTYWGTGGTIGRVNGTTLTNVATAPSVTAGSIFCVGMPVGWTYNRDPVGVVNWRLVSSTGASGGANDLCITFQASAGGKRQTSTDTTTSASISGIPTPFADGAWHSATVTWNPTTVSLYEDAGGGGLLASAAPTGQPYQAITAVEIGWTSFAATAQQFDGYVDDLYSATALSGSDLAAISRTIAP